MEGGGRRGQGRNFLLEFDIFFDIQFKNTSNLIFPGFKVPSKRFLFKDFKTGLNFWHIWFFNFQNLVQICQHIGGTPCIYIFFFSVCTIFLNPQKFDQFGFRIIPFILNHVSPTLLITLLAIRIVLKHGQSIIRVLAWKSSHLKIIRA